jgi:hypothetical protein
MTQHELKSQSYTQVRELYFAEVTNMFIYIHIRKGQDDKVTPFYIGMKRPRSLKGR